MNRFVDRRVALMAALFIFVASIVLVGRRLSIEGSSSLSCLVEDTRSGGGAAIRSWAEQMGWHTLPLRAPIWEVESQLQAAGHCIVTAGNGSWKPFGHFSPDDWHLLSNWIQKGNSLIVVTSNPSTLPDEVQQLFGISDAAEDSDDDPRVYFTKHAQQVMDVKPAEFELVPTCWGGEMSVDAKGPRLHAFPEQQQLAARENGSVLSVATHGQGSIYLLLDDSAWTNGGFDRADNAATLARVIRQSLGPNGILVFDEQRHGFGRPESFTTLFLTLPGARQCSVLALVLGLFWLWNSTRRFNPAEEFRQTERRTAMEYVDSVASIYQRARAAPLTISAVLNRLRYLLKKRGIENQTANDTMNRAAQLAALGDRPASPHREIATVTELIRVRKDFYGTR